MKKATQKIMMGRITGVYGVKGWVKVFSYADPMESIVTYNPWYIRPQHKQLGSKQLDNRQPESRASEVGPSDGSVTKIRAVESIAPEVNAVVRHGTTVKHGRSLWTKVVLEAGKRHAKTVVAKFEHCNNRDEAQLYIGYEVAIERDQLERLSETGEYYWRDLIGLRVINQQDVELGEVTDILETGANDVLVVTAEAGRKEYLIPWTMHLAIVSVDLEQGVVEVDWDADF